MGGDVSAAVHVETVQQPAAVGRREQWQRHWLFTTAESYSDVERVETLEERVPRCARQLLNGSVLLCVLPLLLFQEGGPEVRC